MNLNVEDAKRIAKKLGATYHSINEFKAGAHNKMFLLKTTTGKYLIRVRTNSVQYHEALSTEYSVLQKVGREFAPRVFFLDRSRRILPQEYFVEEFIEGRTPRQITAGIAKKQSEYYRRLHNAYKAPVPRELAIGGKYSLRKKLEQLVRRAPHVDAETKLLIKELRTHARKYESLCARKIVSLTQDDPTRGNILLTKNGLRMVDWEFAHYDLPEWDLAFCVWSVPEYEREYLRGYGIKNSRIIDILLPIHTLGMLLWQLERLNMIRRGTVKGQTHNNRRQFLKEIAESKQRIREYLQRNEKAGLDPVSRSATVTIAHIWTDNGVRVRFTWIDASSHRRFSPITQAYGLCFSDRGKLFIGKSPPLFHRWTLPGGTIERGETPEQTLTRELDEELSLHIITFKLLGAQKVEYLNRQKKTHYQLRYAVMVRPKRSTPDPDYGISWKRKAIDKEKFSDYIDWGPIGTHLIIRAGAWFDAQQIPRKQARSARQ